METLKNTPFGADCRIVCEEWPPKPSPEFGDRSNETGDFQQEFEMKNKNVLVSPTIGARGIECSPLSGESICGEIDG